MKEGWEYKKLGEVATFINGDRSANYPSKKDYVVDGIPFVNAGNLIQAGLDSASLNLISQNKYDSLSQGKFVEGDILFCLRGTLGKHSIVQNGLKGAIASSLVIIRTKDGFCNKYISYYLDYKQPFIERLNNGAAQPNIPAKTMKGFSILVPPLSEQQSIVDYLDSAFAKIDAMKANAEKSLNEAKALFQASLKEMLEPKEGWEEKYVGDIAEIKGGKRLPKGEKLQSEPTNHKYIRVADFNDYGTVDLSDIQYISDKVFEQIKRYIITKDDIYISIAGTIGKSGIIPDELDGANLTENACRLILSNEIYQKFMYYITISPEFVRQEIESTKISAQPKLALTRLAGIIISYPSIIEQQKIAETLDSLKSKVDRLQENYDKISQECDALKQALLRKVFEK